MFNKSSELFDGEEKMLFIVNDADFQSKVENQVRQLLKKAENAFSIAEENESKEKYYEAIELWNKALAVDPHIERAIQGIKEADNRIKILEAIVNWNSSLYMENENKDFSKNSDDVDLISSLLKSADEFYSQGTLKKEPEDIKKAIQLWEKILDIDKSHSIASDGIIKGKRRLSELTKLKNSLFNEKSSIIEKKKKPNKNLPESFIKEEPIETKLSPSFIDIDFDKGSSDYIEGSDQDKSYQSDSAVSFKDVRNILEEDDVELELENSNKEKSSSQKLKKNKLSSSSGTYKDPILGKSFNKVEEMINQATPLTKNKNSIKIEESSPPLSSSNRLKEPNKESILPATEIEGEPSNILKESPNLFMEESNNILDASAIQIHNSDNMLLNSALRANATRPQLISKPYIAKRESKYVRFLKSAPYWLAIFAFIYFTLIPALKNNLVYSSVLLKKTGYTFKRVGMGMQFLRNRKEMIFKKTLEIKLKKAQELYEKNIFLEPEGQNAVSLLHEVQQMDPTNKQAKELLGNITKYYEKLGDEALTKKKVTEALKYYTLANKTDPYDESVQYKLYKLKTP